MKKLPCYCMILFALLKSAQYLKYWRFPENRSLYSVSQNRQFGAKMDYLSCPMKRSNLLI